MTISCVRCPPGSDPWWEAAGEGLWALPGGAARQARLEGCGGDEGDSYSDGVYGEVREGPVVYYRREEQGRWGDYWFLYPVSGGRWVLGYGGTYEERSAVARGGAL